MTREERIAQNETWFIAQKEKKDQIEKIKSDYNKLSYRDKLLFYTVVSFLRENPE